MPDRSCPAQIRIRVTSAVEAVVLGKGRNRLRREPWQNGGVPKEDACSTSTSGIELPGAHLGLVAAEAPASLYLEALAFLPVKHSPWLYGTRRQGCQCAQGGIPISIQTRRDPSEMLPFACRWVKTLKLCSFHSQSTVGQMGISAELPGILTGWVLSLLVKQRLQASLPSRTGWPAIAGAACDVVD